MMICLAHTKKRPAPQIASSKEDIFTAPVFLELWFDSILCQKDKVWNNCESLIQFRNLSVSVSTPMHPNHHQHNQVKVKVKYSISKPLGCTLFVPTPIIRSNQVKVKVKDSILKPLGRTLSVPDAPLHPNHLSMQQCCIALQHLWIKINWHWPRSRLLYNCYSKDAIVVKPGCCWQNYFSWHGSWRTMKTRFFGDALTTRTR